IPISPSSNMTLSISAVSSASGRSADAPAGPPPSASSVPSARAPSSAAGSSPARVSAAVSASSSGDDPSSPDSTTKRPAPAASTTRTASTSSARLGPRRPSGVPGVPGGAPGDPVGVVVTVRPGGEVVGVDDLRVPAGRRTATNRSCTGRQTVVHQQQPGVGDAHVARQGQSGGGALHRPARPYGGTVILPKERDPRFITIRRGGTLTDEDHRLLALWAATCAQHVLHFFEQAQPDDDRPHRAIE